MNIIFFGSGPFAFPLAQCIHARVSLSGITIAKPKPRGRGLTIKMPLIAQWGKENGINVFSPENPNHNDFLKILKELKPDLYVLASYGHILGPSLLSLARFGGINVHPSLLPRYRGPAPIQRTLMAGEKETGLTMIFIDEKVDHGDIIFQQIVAIEPDDTYGFLMERLSIISTEHIHEMIDAVKRGTCHRVAQDHSQKSYAKKIKKEETIIQWKSSTDSIVNLIRALSPKPGACTTFRGNELKILDAIHGTRTCPSGVVCLDGKDVTVGTGDGSIVIHKVKPANKSFMTGLDFKNGFRIHNGELMQ